MKLSNFWIPFFIWIGLLVIIGLSIDMRWGSPYGVWIPLAFLMLSFREVLKLGKDEDKNTEPRKDSIHKDKSIKITQEDIEGDLHEGRD
tara:strand:- start:1090 stop:1356 length:267 start_codon:yes stop_codon:yes gene_type:complete